MSQRIAFIMSSNGPKNYNQLKYTNDDAKTIAEVLIKEEYGFKIFPETPESKKYLILDSLSKVVEICESHDDFIFYFSGHGNAAYGKLHLILDETDFEEKNSFERTSLPIADILSVIDTCKAKNILIILDCCHGGAIHSRYKSTENSAFNENSSPAEFQTIIDKSQSYHILLASDKLEKTREIEMTLPKESKLLKGGFLTIHLYRALTEKPSGVLDDKENISIFKINEWLETETEQFNKKNSHLQPIPTPFITESKVKGKPFIFNKIITSSIKSLPVSIASLNEGCPYIGLKPFSINDEAIFFGRKSVIEQLDKKVQDYRFVFLVGASGSGKSSIVQAGLAPRLKKANWRVLNPIKPVSYLLSPYDNLVSQLVKELGTDRDSIDTLTKNIKLEGLGVVSKWVQEEQRVLVIIDQFEEIFQEYESDKDKKNLEEFVQALNELIKSPDNNKISVIATLRSDFTGDCSKSEILTHFIQDCAVWIPPLQMEEIKEIIEKPVQETGYSVQPQLVDLIIKDIQKEDNFLPVLQFALHEIWSKLDKASKEITLEHYSMLCGEENQGLGSILSILNKHAENIYNQCNPTEQIWIKRIFVKLFRIGEKSSRDTRQRLPKQRIIDMAGGIPENQRIIQSVLDKLTKSLLVVGYDKHSDYAWIDLAHEALMNAWARFAKWREEHRSIRPLLDRIEVEYQEFQKDPKYLIGGGLLGQINKQFTDLSPYLDKPIMELISRSRLENENISIDKSTLLQVKQQNEIEILQHKLEFKDYQLQREKDKIELQNLQSQIGSKDEMLTFYKGEISKLNQMLAFYQEQVAALISKLSIVESKELITTEVIKQPVNTYNFSGRIGDVFLGNQGDVTGNQHNYAPERNLTEAAEEIQSLLKKLEETNPNATEIEQVNYINAATSSEFKERVVKALKATDSKVVDMNLFLPTVKAFLQGLMSEQD